jgi:hypothetical protein
MVIMLWPQRVGIFILPPPCENVVIFTYKIRGMDKLLTKQPSTWLLFHQFNKQQPKPENKHHNIYHRELERPRHGWEIILKWIFTKWDGEAWIGFVWLRIGTGGWNL